MTWSICKVFLKNWSHYYVHIIFTEILYLDPHLNWLNHECFLTWDTAALKEEQQNVGWCHLFFFCNTSAVLSMWMCFSPLQCSVNNLPEMWCYKPCLGFNHKVMLCSFNWALHKTWRHCGLECEHAGWLFHRGCIYVAFEMSTGLVQNDYVHWTCFKKHDYVSCTFITRP